MAEKEIYKCRCIKCKNEYQSDNPDDIDGWYCATCLEARKQIAAEIDEKFKGRKPRTTRAFDELPLVHGTNFIDFKRLK